MKVTRREWMVLTGVLVAAVAFGQSHVVMALHL
jgi:hypothetical protein